MVIAIFGPAGAGKSTQGQMLAEELGRVWLSSGEMLRMSRRFDQYTRVGAFVPERELVELIMEKVLAAEAQGKGTVWDGQPGTPQQVEYWKELGLMERLEGVVLLQVPREESLRRLARRGRGDDRPEVWGRKLEHFEQKICSFLTPVKEADVPIWAIDGVGKPEEVHQRIMRVMGRS